MDEIREPITEEEKCLVAKGHGVTIGACGHVLSVCRCHTGSNLLRAVSLDLCEECLGGNYTCRKCGCTWSTDVCGHCGGPNSLTANVDQDPQMEPEMIHDLQIEEIKAKIESHNITAQDFNQLINESLPSSSIDRVRRRTRRTPTKSHIDAKGHQPMQLPKLSARVLPKRRPNNTKSQMTHRGKSAHRKSARTQKRQYAEALRFIKKYVGKRSDEYKIALENLQDKNALLRLIVNLFPRPSINKEWLRMVYEDLYAN